MRREEEDPVKVAWRHPIEGRRTVGRQRIRWRDIVERNLRVLNLREEEAQDRSYWRRRQRTRATTPPGIKAKKKKIECIQKNWHGY